MPDRPPVTAVPLVGGAALVSLDSARRRRAGRSRVIRVLLVGAHALARAGLRRLLEDDADLMVIGEAADGLEGARLLRRAQPDVVLLDAGPGAPDPAAVMRALGARVPVLLVSDDEDDRLFAALRAGAAGALASDSHPAELAPALRTLAGGGALLPPRTVRRLIAELVDSATHCPR